MKTFTTAFVFSNIALLVAAQGTQFVTGPCTSDSDCAEGCCAFNTGLCAGPVVAQQNADGGCGFGNPTPNNNAAKALGFTIAAPGVPTATDAPAAPAAAPPAAVATTPSSEDDSQGTENLGNGEGKQFITGVCDSDADCASTCCASGLCSAIAVAAAKGGCGFVANGTSDATTPAAEPAAAAAPAPATSNVVADAQGTENLGNGEGKQFITGVCDSNADCASACCASGLCSAVAVAAAKGGCGFVASKRMLARRTFWA